MKLAAHIKLSWIPVVFILLIASMPAYIQAQSNTLILNGVQTGPINNTACKEIRLQDGYKYTAQGSNIMHSFIDLNLICDVDYIPPFTNTTIPPLNTSLEVGTTPGSFAVSPTGAATYNIPIPVPPGTAGMVPNLSVVYNSQGGNGMLGMAWNLAGLSSITRVGQTLYHDAKITGVDLSYNDRFALDGNRLLNVNIDYVYGADGTRYSTELEGFSRITSYSDAAYNPNYFIVETKDGSLLEYGNTPDSRIEATGSSIVLTWLLNKVTDSKGNYMNFYYYENNATGEYRPDYIEYTGNAKIGANLLPYNKVKFVYGTRQDKQLAYVAGHQVQTNTLLTGIVMYEGANKTHEYVFDYTYDMNSHLKEITENGMGGLRYNSTKFVWNGNNVNPSSVPYNIALTPGKLTHTCVINGDGFDDVVDISSTSYRVFLNDKNGGFIAAGPGTNYTSLGYNIAGTENLKPDLITSDFDGDGFDDVVILSTNSNGKTFRCSFLKSNATHTDLVEDLSGSFEVTPDNPDNKNGWANFKYAVGDFDGDGAADLFVYCYDGDQGYLRRFRSDSPLTTEKVFPYGGASGDFGDVNLTLTTVDMNGDGKQEVLLTYQSQSSLLQYDGSTFIGISTMGFPQSGQRIYPGDFNGDGKTDLLSWSTSGWYVNYATGNGLNFNSFFASGIANYGDPNNYINYHTYFVRDFNGDGKSDILDVGVPGGTGTTFFGINYSNGNAGSFASSFNNGSGTAPEAFQLFDGNHDPIAEFLGDFDGDGRSEIYYNAKNGNSALTCKVTFMPGLDVHKVNTIVDGLGNKTHIDYNTLPVLSEPNLSQYTKGNGAVYPVNDFQKAITVVSASNSNHDAFGDYNNVSYSYTGAKIHLAGKGFLGLTKFKTTNTSTGFVTEDSYNTTMNWLTGNFFQPVLDDSKTTTTVGQNVSEKVMNHYTFKYGANLPQGGNGYYFYCDSWNEIDYLHGNTTVFGVNQDNYGNILTQSSSHAAGTSTVTNTYEAMKAWIPSRLVTSQTTSIRLTAGVPEPAYTRSVTIENLGGGGLPSKKTDDTGLITEYTYNYFGLPETTKVSGPTIQQRSTFTEYDAQKRFAVKQTNALGHIIQNTYDPAYGNMLTAQDANGLITSFVYDGMGSLKETTSPIGTKVTKTKAWDISTYPKSLYSLTTTQTDGSYSKQYYDPLARTLRSETKAFDGSIIYSTKTYNNVNQLLNESEPNSTALFTSYTYETDYKRLQHVSFPSGATTDYAYSGNTVTTTNTLNGVARVESKTSDAAGLVVSSTDAASGTLAYLYHSSSKPRQITAPGNVITTMNYDAYGRQVKLTEPNAGITTYAYNELGQLMNQQTAKQFATNSTYSTSTTYDLLGRPTLVHEDNPAVGDINYTYDNATGKGIGLPNTIIGYGVNKAFTYDNYSRLLTKSETVDGTPYTYSYTYDSQGRVDQETYPGAEAFTIKNTYNAYGYLSNIDKVGGTAIAIWQCNSMNERGQITQATLCNSNLVRTSLYTNLGNLQNQQLKNGALTLYSTDYNFNAQTGNLFTRKDIGRNLTETFSYDNLDRLTQVSKTTATQTTVTLNLAYSPNGNISNKGDVGDYGYNAGSKPHAVNQITTPSTEMQGLLTQNITYTSFSKVATIFNQTAGQGYNAAFAYGPDQQRTKMTVLNGATEQYRRYYIGKYEKTITGTITRELHYVGNVLYVRNTTGGTVIDSLYYLQTDHLGSIVLIANVGITTNTVAVTQERSYDAWGRQRNPADWSYTGIQAFKVLTRGYTGHEHIYLPTIMNIAGGELINMNGRMYDPVVGRMLSPDNFVQAAGNTQNSNRYSYVLNNPLKYSDPSGEFFGLAVWGMTFAGTSIFNVATGVSDPFKNAYNNANLALNNLSSVGQVTVCSNQNTRITAGLDLGGAGISVNAQYRKGDFSASTKIGFGVFGPSIGGSASEKIGDFRLGLSGGYSTTSNFSGWYGGGGVSYTDHNSGWTVGYAGNYYGGVHSQYASELSIAKGDFSLRVNEDYGFSDKFRTGGIQIGVGEFTFGGLVYTNDPGSMNGGRGDGVINKDSPMWGTNTGRNKTWENGEVYFAPAYIGISYGNTIDRIGFSDPSVQDFLQNGAHHTFRAQNYYLNYDHFQGGFYQYNGYNNPYSIY